MISYNVLFGSLFYYYSLNTNNDECTLLKQTAIYFTLYCTCSIILSIITLIGNKTFNAITTMEGLIRMLFLIAFLVNLIYYLDRLYLKFVMLPSSITYTNISDLTCITIYYCLYEISNQ